MSYSGKNPVIYKLDGYVSPPSLSPSGQAFIVFDDGSGEILKSTNGSVYSPFGGLVIADTISGTIQTVGAVTDVVASYNIADDTAVTILILVTGRETGGSQAAGYLLQGVFRRTGGTVTQIGSTAVISQF